MSVLEARTGFVVLGWRRGMSERLLIAVPIVTYTLLVAVFASIFRATPLGELPERIRVGAPALIWYLAITEMITFAGGYTFQEVRADVLDGQFVASLARPMSYIATKFWGWLGHTTLRVVVFFSVGIALATALSGSFTDWRLLPLIWICVTIGALTHGIIYCALALLEVWGPYARPAMWISQKFCFLLGGLLLPIRFYPGWLQALAWFTPYPAILNVPGRLALAPTGAQMVQGLAIQIFWLLALLGLAFFVQYRATKKILSAGA
jgi:ABC-2 type transport system permease protein